MNATDVNLYLVGFMGTGKSTVGRAVAHKLGFAMVDSDHEIERRTLEMYAAYYCTDLRELLAFSKKNDVAWFVVNRTMFDQLEEGDSQLFEPTRGKILRATFEPNQAKGFALRAPPASIVAFELGDIRVLSMHRLEALLAPAR